ncbi:acyltransferase [Flavobacterium sp.]|uniref:acyltransferase n=1 Tax=Flavobacterium sp. TaxID=239 RepID=UPI00391D5C6E
MGLLRNLYQKMQLYYSINWTKTLYFNFKKFPFQTARKLPCVFFGKVNFQDISGEIILNAPIESGMFGFGHHFEIAQKSKGMAEFILKGKLIINGPVHMGKDVLLYIAKNAVCEMGYMSCLGSNVKLICTNKITIGDWTGIGYESQIIDTNSHPMKNSITGQYYPISSPIILGTHNAVSNRVSIMPNTSTPDFCVIASNTVCNKDYSGLGNNILIGGVPAKLIKNDYTRDWEGEKELLKKYKIIRM